MDAPEQAQAINLVHQNKLHHETTYDDKLSDFAKGYVNRTSPAPIRPIQPLTTKQYKSLTFFLTTAWTKKIEAAMKEAGDPQEEIDKFKNGVKAFGARMQKEKSWKDWDMYFGNFDQLKCEVNDRPFGS